MAERTKRDVVYLKVTELQPNPLQPRGLLSAESLEELTASIKEHGILEPLIVAKTPVGYQIIAGERRWKAAKIVGLKTVPCLIEETTPRGMLEMALVENVQREDLNPLERAQAFKRLINEFNLSSNEIAERIGKSLAYVSNSVRLLELPDAIKDGLISDLITEGHARALAGVRNLKLMLEAYKLVLKNSYNVRNTEELARRANKGEVYQKAKQLGKIEDHEQLFSEETERMRRQITQLLGGAKVKISRSIRETRIQIILKGNPEATQAALQKIYQAICQS